MHCLWIRRGKVFWLHSEHRCSTPSGSKLKMKRWFVKLFRAKTIHYSDFYISSHVIQINYVCLLTVRYCRRVPCANQPIRQRTNQEENKRFNWNDKGRKTNKFVLLIIIWLIRRVSFVSGLYTCKGIII